VQLKFGPEGAPGIALLLVVPNRRDRPAPVFLGLNFCGNHAALDDPQVALPAGWVRQSCAGCVDNRATEAGRGSQKNDWSIEASIDRGYAVATFYAGDIDPDKVDDVEGIHRFYFKPGQTEPGQHDWGTIAAWAWGLHRAVDYLASDRDLDPRRIAVTGHSRMGKTALLAGALDERIALVIPHQAGCGGTAPSRHDVGETVSQINKGFPHWFCREFKSFNAQVDRLPFDQHALVALCAPRPVLLTNAVLDTHADPLGQFRVLQAADPVYRFVGVDGLAADAAAESGRFIDSRLGYFLREGEHSITPEDWKVFLDFADKHLPQPQ
jgi:hypothetical protein